MIRHRGKLKQGSLDDRQDNELLKTPLTQRFGPTGAFLSNEWLVSVFLASMSSLLDPVGQCHDYPPHTSCCWLKSAEDLPIMLRTSRFRGWRRSKSRHCIRSVFLDLGRINTCQRPRENIHRTFFAQFTVQNTLVRQMSHFRVIIGPTTHYVAKQKLWWATWIPDPTDPDSGYQP